MVYESHPLKTHVVFHCPSCNVKCLFHEPDMITDFWLVKCHHCLRNIKIIKDGQPDEYSRLIYPKGSSKISNAESNSIKEEIITYTASQSYYEKLGVAKDATPEQIKRVYYKLAMRHHPDKYNGPNPEENEEVFKQITEAYQILSDETLRERYDRYGKDQVQPDGGFADPEKFFQQVFGGDVFVDLIGELSISRDFGDVMAGIQQKDQEMKVGQTPEERERKRRERVLKLASNLLHKMSFYCDNPIITSYEYTNEEKAIITKQFEDRILEEANDLKNASYGVELLKAIGFMYTLKSRQWLGKEETLFGIGKFWNDIREKGHVISETVGTIRSAVELQAALSKLESVNQETDQPHDPSPKEDAKKVKEVSMTPEEKLFWEQKAAEKGMYTLWKGSKMEIEGVIRDVCDLILSGNSIGTIPECSKDELKRRANALKIIGRIYEDTK